MWLGIVVEGVAEVEAGGVARGVSEGVAGGFHGSSRNQVLEDGRVLEKKEAKDILEKPGRCKVTLV